MAGPKILAFAGSTRTASFNKRLLGFAVTQARAAGAEVTHVDLRDLAMPLYDGDLEAANGLPPTARQFKRLLIDHAGFLIASPEYNSSLSGVLKNAIDWASRPEPGEPTLVAFTGKVAALMSASPGWRGGLRGLVPLRSLLSNIGVLVVPGDVAVPRAHETLDPAGKPTEERIAAEITRLAQRLVAVLDRLAEPRPTKKP
jgi:chromate reductase, NAD(P)H dehydrogenase (quinone)